jgi:hypothetical protein
MDVCSFIIEPPSPDLWLGCGCTDPTPDPDSPCGQKDSPKGLPCGATASHDWHDRRMWEEEPELWHPHQPTRCLRCGHAVVPR